MVVSTRSEFPMSQKTVFTTIVDELSLALHKHGVSFEPRENGEISQGGSRIGRVTAWEPGRRVTIVLHSAEWENGNVGIDIRLAAMRGGTRVVVQHSGVESFLRRAGGESLGWFTDQVVTPLILSSTPFMFGDWLTDRTARRPTGGLARRGYRNPTHHRPNFGAILETLALTRHDHLLEVGCGGGALLREALKSGCTAAGVDHSTEMVRLTRRANSIAVRAGRLEVRESDADSLPFDDSAFTRATMTNVLGFLEDPVRVFREVNRVLSPGGLMVVFSTSKEAKGSIAAPEPMASRIHFYEDEEIEKMALGAGFTDAHVERPDLSRFLKGSGIPRSEAASFSARIGQLLRAKKPLLP